jgi:(2Fe-2S) ferredoxin
MADLNFLREIEVFKGLDNAQLGSIQACCSEEEFHQDEQLFAEKEKALCFWIVKGGSVKLKFELPGGRAEDGNTIATISEKSIIGWSSFVPPYKYTLSAYCASRTCRVIKVNNECLTDLFKSDSRIGYLVLSYMIRVIGSRFQDMQQSTLMAPYVKTKVIVHMATCGISAGAREVMTALMDEISKTGRGNIKVESSGCIGTCQNEPNVTVEISGESTVVYKNMTPDRMREVFRKHVLMGEIQTDYLQ